MGVASVRPAQASDAQAAARLQLEVWQQAYSEILPASVLLADPEMLAAGWVQRIGGAGTVLLAFEGEQAVGLAVVSAATDADGRGDIELLHVLPRWSRRGHGGRLLGAAAAELRTTGAIRGAWWAPETDRSVERFLAGVSWFVDGGRRELDTGEGTFAEVRYSGSLDLVLI